jgi:hypothetical protein
MDFSGVTVARDVDEPVIAPRPAGLTAPLADKEAHGFERGNHIPYPVDFVRREPTPEE